jgi:hypothetical protein
VCRDERQGYGGDAMLSAEAAMFNLDMTASYIKFLRCALVVMVAGEEGGR